MSAAETAARIGGAPATSFIEKIFDALPGAVAYWDAALLCRFANKAFFDWFGKSPQEVLGTHYRDLSGERFYAANEPFISRALAGERVSYERSLRAHDGRLVHIFVSYIPDIEDDGHVAGFFVQVNDVTQIKSAEAQLEIATAVFDHTADGIIVTDAAGAILSVNPAFTEITGYLTQEAVGQTPKALLRSDRQGPDFYQAMRDELTSRGRWQGELWNRRKSGEIFRERQTITRLLDPLDGSLRYVCVFSDITELWLSSERVRYLAYHDALTDLPNRPVAIEQLCEAIAAAQSGSQHLAVMFIDLDGFKAVNDRLGHECGDALLIAVSQKLRRSIRSTDVVARIGGDEFIAILHNVPDDKPVARVAAALVKTINEPIMLAGEAVQVGVSIGVALYPAHGLTAADLIRHADEAMYEAKNDGKNCYRFARCAKSDGAH